jgi:HD-like signal output (HDOD) protein
MEVRLSSDMISKAEEFVFENFRNTSLEHPFVKSLRDIATDYMGREIMKHPESFLETHQSPSFLDEKVFEKPAKPLSPLELFINEVKLPALPQALIELLRVINDPHCSAADLAEVISLDTSLSSYLLRMVNSAYYSFPFPIDTITRAVTLIGTKEISALAFSRSFLNTFNESPPDFFDMEQFWKHSIACGIVARALAKRCNKTNPNRHFVAGLLHDLGRLIIFSNIPHLGGEALFKAVHENIPLHAVELTLFGFDHARFGGSLLKKWNFPSTLTTAVLHHHSPEKAHGYDEAVSIHLSDFIVKGLGIGLSGDSHLPPLRIQLWEELGLSTQDLTQLVDGIEDELETTFRLLLGLNGE